VDLDKAMKLTPDTSRELVVRAYAKAIAEDSPRADAVGRWGQRKLRDQVGAEDNREVARRLIVRLSSDPPDVNIRDEIEKYPFAALAVRGELEAAGYRVPGPRDL